ncbi:MAG: electron transfer flavoprotein subunit alpha/FixB family protein, partial [Acidobacteriota bacterium]
SLEALRCGQEIAADQGVALHAVLLGKDLASVAEQLSRVDLTSVICLVEDQLEHYRPESFCAALASLLREDDPQLLLMSHSYQNIDLAPRLAARLKVGLVTDCVGFKNDGQGLVFVRQMFRNKLNADVVVQSPAPWLVSLQAGAFSAEELVGGNAEIVERTVDLASVTLERQLHERVGMTRDRVDLSKAEVIIGVGRGIKKEENLEMIRRLAELLHAEIGASRPVVDSDWLERDRQIGSSGQNVAPKLYIALGISGAIQHVVGIKNSGCIVAVNSDRNAPIFNVASYGIVGDLNEVVPALIARLQNLAG